MGDYRITWAATGEVIGYIHNVDKVVSGADLTFFFDGGMNILLASNTPLIAFVLI